MVLLLNMDGKDNVELLEIIKKLVINDEKTYAMDVLEMKKLVLEMPIIDRNSAVDKDGNKILENEKLINKRYYKLLELEKFLIKHDDKNFYCITKGNEIFKNTSHVLYTQEDIEKLLPNGIDINKISYSGGNKLSVIKTPEEYSQTDEKIYFYSQLSYKYNNFKTINNEASKMAIWHAYFSS